VKVCGSEGQHPFPFGFGPLDSARLAPQEGAALVAADKGADLGVFGLSPT